MFKKNPLIKGTLILIITGLLTRIIGFFFRIFLVQGLGADGMGIFQLVFPVQLFLCSLCSMGIQTVISSMSAADKTHSRTILKNALFISLILSVFSSSFLYLFSDKIAMYILSEPRCTSALKYIAFSIPFASIHTCICGYYYGIKKAAIPGISQLIEQLVRVFATYLIYLTVTENTGVFTPANAVIGAIIGELASSAFCLLSLNIKKISFFNIGYIKKIALSSIPLTANRMMLSIFQSAEAILIPLMLKIHGHSTVDALSIYGILTGMAIPFIMFPATITNSLSTLLLPAISECNSTHNINGIKRVTEKSICLSIYLGIFCTGIFFKYGCETGKVLFHNTTSGYYLFILSWLCTFMYLSTTLSSILNGLKHTTMTFIFNIISISIRIFFTVFVVPICGISAYMSGLLVSYAFLTFLEYSKIKGYTSAKIQFFKNIIFPMISTILALKISSLLPDSAYSTATLMARCSVAGLIYILLLLVFSKKAL